MLRCCSQSLISLLKAQRLFCAESLSALNAPASLFCADSWRWYSDFYRPVEMQMMSTSMFLLHPHSCAFKHKCMISIWMCWSLIHRTFSLDWISARAVGCMVWHAILKKKIKYMIVFLSLVCKRLIFAYKLTALFPWSRPCNLYLICSLLNEFWENSRMGDFWNTECLNWNVRTVSTWL